MLVASVYLQKYGGKLYIAGIRLTINIIHSKSEDGFTTVTLKGITQAAPDNTASPILTV